MISIPFGGKIHSIYKLGFILKVKKDQKIEKKNIISDTMNKIIPFKIPT